MLFAQPIPNPPASDDFRPFEGPNVLGRSTTGFGNRGSAALPIAPFFSVNGSYDTNLQFAGLDPNGRFTPTGSAGVEAAWGAVGQKRLRRSLLGIDYRGNYTQFANASLFNGTNHQLGLSYANRLSKKWMFDTSVVGGTSNRAIGGPAVFAGSDFEFLNVPVNELFDSRVYFLQNQTSATYYPTSRQSFRFGGSGGTIRRKARFLVDANLYGATGDWAYRLGPRTTIGVAYGFNHFDFSKVFGETDMHRLSIVFGRQFGRDWQVSLSAIGFQQSTVGIREVSLDPVLVALLGRAVGREVFESNNYLGGYAFSLSRTINRTVISAQAERDVTPGNGFFLTSRVDNVGASVGHSISRKTSLSGNFGYTRMTSLGFVSTPFSGWIGGASFSYRLSDNLSFIGRADWRKFQLIDSFGRSGTRVSVGLTYSPSNSFTLW